jgi:hypothetical protein
VLGIGEGFFEELEGVGAAETADDDAGVGHGASRSPPMGLTAADADEFGSP